MRTIYWFWSIVVLVMVVLQIAFAGYGAFYAAHKLSDDGSSITDKTFDHGFGIHVGEQETRLDGPRPVHKEPDGAGIGHRR